MLLSLFDRPPFEKGTTWSNWRFCALPHLTHRPRSLVATAILTVCGMCRVSGLAVKIEPWFEVAPRFSALIGFDVRADVLERGFVQRRFFLGRLGSEVDDPHVPRTTRHATSRPLYKCRTTSLLGRPLGLGGSANHRRATSGKDTESVPYKTSFGVFTRDTPSVASSGSSPPWGGL